jgi:hypothetical protein
VQAGYWLVVFGCAGERFIEPLLIRRVIVLPSPRDQAGNIIGEALAPYVFEETVARRSDA